MRVTRGISSVVVLVCAAVVTVTGARWAGACTLPLPMVTVASDAAPAPGDPLSVDALLFELVPADETTTTTMQPGDAEIADCPPIRPVAEVTLRLVQGEDAVDLVTLQPDETRFTTEVTIPTSATSGPARLVAAVDGEAELVSDEFTVNAPVSPPAPPTVDEPTFTG